LKIISFSKVSTKNQITLPSEVREHFNVEMGDRVIFRLNDQNEVVIDMVKKTPAKSFLGALRTSTNNSENATEDSNRGEELK